MTWMRSACPRSIEIFLSLFSGLSKRGEVIGLLSESLVLGVVCCVLDVECWILGFVYWVLGVGLWILGWLYLKTHSLLAPVLFHAAANIFLVLALLILT